MWDPGKIINDKPAYFCEEFTLKYLFSGPFVFNVP